MRKESDGIRRHARALAARGAAKGGTARANSMSAEERKASARNAAVKRWGTDLPKETHRGVLRIGATEIPCANLDNGMRVLSTVGLTRAFGSKKKGVNTRDRGTSPQLPPFLAAHAIKSCISEDLLQKLTSPLPYKPERGGLGMGFEAHLLPKVCEVILEARSRGSLTGRQEELAAVAEALVRGLAMTGIIALVDEATGYQADRARDELSTILAAYIAEELRPYIPLFPHEFFKQIYRLQGWEYREGTTRRPRYVGKLINEYIYKRLPPGVHEELVKRNPSINGRRRSHHHRHLTEHTGVPHLDKQIASVTTLMAVSDDKTMFDSLFKKRFPKSGDQLRLPDGAEDE